MSKHNCKGNCIVIWWFHCSFDYSYFLQPPIQHSTIIYFISAWTSSTNSAFPREINDWIIVLKTYIYWNKLCIDRKSTGTGHGWQRVFYFLALHICPGTIAYISLKQRICNSCTMGTCTLPDIYTLALVYTMGISSLPYIYTIARGQVCIYQPKHECPWYN